MVDALLPHRTLGTTTPEEPGGPVAVVTGSDQPAGAVMAAMLTERGFDVLALLSPPAIAHVGERHLHPSHSSQYVDIPLFTRVVVEHGAALLVPTLRHELPAVAAARTLLEATGARVLVAGAGPVAVTSDRLFATAHLNSRGVAVPRYVFPGDVTDRRALLHRFGGALVALPRSTGCGCSPALITSASDDAWDWLDDSWMLREAMPGHRYRILVHRPPQGREGRTATVIHDPSASLDVRFPGPSGRSARAPAPVRIVSEPQIERTAIAAVRAVGLTGPASIEVYVDRGGTPTVTEIDPGFGQLLRLVPEMLDPVLDALALPEARASLRASYRR